MPVYSKKSINLVQTNSGISISISFCKIDEEQTGKFTKFFDINDLKLIFKVYIGYRNITFNERIETPKKKKMIISSLT